jgi:membrane-associated PAP2 superfamily phosphatase
MQAELLFGECGVQFLFQFVAVFQRGLHRRIKKAQRVAAGILGLIQRQISKGWRRLISCTTSQEFYQM